jgi:L-2-hydroxyglutarate oxidase LhgO
LKVNKLKITEHFGIPMPDQQFDLVIIGGGVVGLSTALHMLHTFPQLRLLLVEKEDRVARHQSGHNSGVIHSGIYYKPGSLKARLCVTGRDAMVAFCAVHDIPYEICGKLIVAVTEDEVPRMQALYERGNANGITGLKMLSRTEAREIEPNVGGIAWLKVPSTGITDYVTVCQKYAELIVERGGTLKIGTEVRGIVRRSGETMIETTQGTFGTRYVINCGGLQSDRISLMSGKKPEVQIIPFRGEYYDLAPQSQHLIKHLIYPVPDLRFPFLGVHFTRRVRGGIDAGPNAVLAFKREGYKRGDFSFRDSAGTFSYSGFWKMAFKYWQSGLGEFYRSSNKAAFVRALQRLLPILEDSDLVPDGSGVRAQAVRPDGSLVDDFQFVASENMLHVWNVPSPAATASLAIGQEIVGLAQRALHMA